MDKIPYQVLLYYKYINIPDPTGLMDAQRALCELLNLKGRIIVASEGINGTVEGTIEDTEKYIEEMNTDQRFVDIRYKKSTSDGHAFPRLSIKVRDEIVTSGTTVNPALATGKYIESDELHSWFNEQKEFYVVDMRNDYEYISGHFQDSLLSGFSNFRDLPTVLPKIAPLKNKTIVTVCTGGVRCEKASGFLVANGFSNVYQLKDGIQTYMEKYPNTHFKGKLYVFDNRLTIGFSTDAPEHQVVGVCDICGKSADSYVNCEVKSCHKHFICCEACRDSQGLAYCGKHQDYLHVKEPMIDSVS